jgi:hypothetical protein
MYKMPQGNPFSTSNRNKMGSNYLTDINQGGGSKKAGSPCDRVGISTWGKRALMCTDPIQGRCCKMTTQWIFPLVSKVSQSRPIGTVSNVPYWDRGVPGVPGRSLVVV